MKTEYVTSDMKGHRSPSVLTTQLYLSRGWMIDACERWCGRIKKDLFGFADHVAVCNSKKIDLIQSTTKSNRSSRLRRLAGSCEARTMADKSPIRVVLCTWSRSGAKGERGRLWAGRVDILEFDDFIQSTESNQ